MEQGGHIGLYIAFIRMRVTWKTNPEKNGQLVTCPTELWYSVQIYKTYQSLFMGFIEVRFTLVLVHMGPLLPHTFPHVLLGVLVSSTTKRLKQNLTQIANFLVKITQNLC